MKPKAIDLLVKEIDSLRERLLTWRLALTDGEGLATDDVGWLLCIVNEARWCGDRRLEPLTSVSHCERVTRPYDRCVARLAGGPNKGDECGSAVRYAHKVKSPFDRIEAHLCGVHHRALRRRGLLTLHPNWTNETLLWDGPDDGL